MDKCVGCHNTMSKNNFQLYRPFQGSQSEVAVRNLQTVLGQIDRDRYANSELLDKATKIHAASMVKPAIAYTGHRQFQTLKEWSSWSWKITALRRDRIGRTESSPTPSRCRLSESSKTISERRKGCRMPE